MPSSRNCKSDWDSICRSKICAIGCWVSPIRVQPSSSRATHRIVRAHLAQSGLEHRLRPLHAEQRRFAAGAAGAQPRGCARAHRRRSLGGTEVNASGGAAVARAGEAQFVLAHLGAPPRRLSRAANLLSVRRSVRRDHDSRALRRRYSAQRGRRGRRARGGPLRACGARAQGRRGMRARRRHRRASSEFPWARDWAAAAPMRQPVSWR